jgi:hypothetical protein
LLLCFVRLVSEYSLSLRLDFEQLPTIYCGS